VPSFLLNINSIRVDSLFNPCKSKGGHNDLPPLEKISATLSFVIHFAHRLLRKRWMDEENCAIETWPKSKKLFPKISIYRFAGTIWKDKLNLKVDSESLDIYLTPCKKAKRSDIYFSCYRHLKSAYFCRFRVGDKLSRKFDCRAKSPTPLEFLVQNLWPPRIFAQNLWPPKK